MSQDPLHDPPPTRPAPLDYGRPDPPRILSALIFIALGLILGAAGIAFVGCGVMNVVKYPVIAGPYAGPYVPRPPVQWWPPALFFGVVAGSIAGLVLAWRSPSRRWLVIGLLLGAGLMSLLEGFCFASG